MRVTVLGTRGNVKASATGHAKHSGLLVDGKLLFDLGEACYLDHHPTHIFITHLHPDHAVLTSAPDARVRLYVPEPTRQLRDAQTVEELITVDDYRIMPVPTVHSQRVRSVGYVVKKGDRSFFFSSDMLTIQPRYRERLVGVNVVITEGSYIRRGGFVRIDRDSGERYGHAGIPDLIRFFRPYAQSLVITHFGSWFYRDVSASIRRIESLGNGVRIVAAYDGLSFDI